MDLVGIRAKKPIKKRKKTDNKISSSHINSMSAGGSQDSN